MSNQYIDVRKEYVERVKRELLGPGSEVSIPDIEHELISSSPSVRYSIGILFPQKQRLTKDNDDATDEEVVTENESVAVDDDSNQVKRILRKDQKPVPIQKMTLLMNRLVWQCKICLPLWAIRFLPRVAVIRLLLI